MGKDADVLCKIIELFRSVINFFFSKSGETVVYNFFEAGLNSIIELFSLIIPPSAKFPSFEIPETT